MPDADRPLPNKFHSAVEQTRRAYRSGTDHRLYSTSTPLYNSRHLTVAVTKAHLTRAFEILNRLVWLLERSDFEFKDMITTVIVLSLLCLFVATDCVTDEPASQ